MMKTNNIGISVVIPVYNSRDCLPELAKQLTDTLDQFGRTYEIIMVDDASPDKSWEVIEKLASEYDHVKAISLMRNVGQAKGTICGLTHAIGDVVVTMDDDLQHRPDQLPILLQALDEHPEIDCVFGTFKDKKHAGYRNFGSKMLRWINARAFGLPSNLRSSSFRVMRSQLAHAVVMHQTDSPAIGAEVFSSTNRLLSVPIEHSPRFSGQSNYTFRRQMRLALDNVCNVSMLPLRAVSVLGFAFCLFGLIFLLGVLYKYFAGHIRVAGWTTVVILVTFSAGVTLLSLGVMGEYMVRILRQVRGAPRFIPRTKIGFDVTA